VSPAPQAPNHTPPTEAETRAEWIDVALARMGWNVADQTQVRTSFFICVLLPQSQSSRKVETLKACHEQSSHDLDPLYTSLSQKAFSGTLDLSRIQVK